MSADVEAAGREAERKVVGPWPPILAGLLAAVVGYGSSFAIVLQGLIGVGATPAQAESGLLALGTMMGLAAIVFGLRTRMPIAIAWSTPGAALLAATGAIEGGFAAAVGAFIVAGALVVLAGLWKPLGRAVLAIPAPLANAMLAGVLLSFCIAPVKAVAEVPMMALPVVIGWVIVTRFARLYAAPAAVVIAAAMYALAAFGVLPGSTTATFQGGWQWPSLEWVTPAFSWSAVVSIALPRIRDFRGLSDRQFDGNGNYTFGLSEQSMFHEIDVDKIDRPRGMDITVVTSATNDDEGRALLRQLGFPFKTN